MRSTPLFGSLLCLSIALGACLEQVDDPELDSDQLSEIQSDLTIFQWANDTQIPDKYSSRPVALASFKNRVYMAYTDYSNISTTELLFAWWDGVAWSTSLTTGKWSTTRPALATYKDRLTMIYRPYGETGLRMTSTANLSWSAPVAAGRSLAIGNYTASSPSATVIGSNLYLTYCATNNSSSYVNVDKYDGTSWTEFKQIPISYGGTACRDALLAAMPEGGVEIIYSQKAGIDPDDGQMLRMRGTIGRSSTVWYPKQTLPMSSKTSVSVVTCNGNTHLVHGGDYFETEIWGTYRANGDWAEDVKSRNQWSIAGPTLGCLNDTTPLMVHNSSGGTNALMQSIFSP